VRVHIRPHQHRGDPGPVGSGEGQLLHGPVEIVDPK
jgi:hypothetical protein